LLCNRNRARTSSTFSPSSASFRSVGWTENLEVERDGRKAVLQASCACCHCSLCDRGGLIRGTSIVLPEAALSRHDNSLRLLSSTCPGSLISQDPPGSATFPRFNSQHCCAPRERWPQTKQPSVSCKSIPVLCKRTECSVLTASRSSPALKCFARFLGASC